ncbi:thermonuclease family protein [Porphyrobacter sp. YT40]|uniref:thermonuclease family protein n=1 Tax=Porphyrobacter sp. YT40 TaxID=2547601 RepID=UPI001141DAB3|nr:thermonuclease family protein [Porphyrobacter sp. YT40]QDH33986.1 thermonuclease family protein [Porphyrobacter sp. YT40]
MLAVAALALACTVIDGDTIRCGSERVRLSGIDAPETSACRPGRRCVEGEGQAARRALRLLIEGRNLRLVRMGRDRYGRTIAAVYADGRNVACSPLTNGHAVYRKDWDNRGLVARDCRI